MKKLFIATAAAALLMLGAGAGIVVAQGMANPSSDVLYEPVQGNPSWQPNQYAEGVTIQEYIVDYSPGCNGNGVATTTRLGDHVVQEIVLTTGYDGAGSAPSDHCSRAGSYSGSWQTQWVPNTN